MGDFDNSSTGNDVKENASNEMLKKLLECAVPVPIVVACTSSPPGRPSYLGEEYHGRLAKGEDKKLVEAKSGRFIVRDTHGTLKENEYTMVFNFNGDVQSLKLVYSVPTKTFKTEGFDRGYHTVLELMTDVLFLYHNLGTLEKQTTLPRNSPKEKPKKVHNFSLHTYLHPKWCDHCKEFLWGLFNQGLKCSDCNLTVHKMCKDSVGMSCEHVIRGKPATLPSQMTIDDAKESAAKGSTLPVFDIKCRYFRFCSRFLSGYNIRDSYIDMRHPATKCFCQNCLDEHVLDVDGKISLDCHPQWTIYQFSKQHDPLNRSVDNWEEVYFPIKPPYIMKMLGECFDPPSGGGDIDLLVAKNFEHTIEDMTNENYFHQFINSETGDTSKVQIVLGMYVRPGGYEGIFLSHNISFDDTCDLQKNHFRVRNTKHIYPKCIFLKIE